MKSRNGKIARLPSAIRDQLNRRLQDGQPGTELVPWLNQLPEVQPVLDEFFDGHPISEQNLSEWKAGGYQDWLARQDWAGHAAKMGEDADEFMRATRGRLTDHLAAALAIRYARLLDGWNGDVSDEFKQRRDQLRGLAQEIASLRRGDHHAAKIQLQQAENRFTTEMIEHDFFERLQRHMSLPAVQEMVSKIYLSSRLSEQEFTRIFGPAATTASTSRARDAREQAQARGRSLGLYREADEPDKPAKPTMPDTPVSSPARAQTESNRIKPINTPEEATPAKPRQAANPISPSQPDQTESNRIKPINLKTLETTIGPISAGSAGVPVPPKSDEGGLPACFCSETPNGPIGPISPIKTPQSTPAAPTPPTPAQLAAIAEDVAYNLWWRRRHGAEPWDWEQAPDPPAKSR